MSFILIVYHSRTSKTTSLIKTIKGARPLPTLRLEEGDCAPIFVQAEVFIQYNDSEEHECNSFPFWKEYLNIIDMVNNFDSKEKTMKILKNLQVKYKKT